MSNLLCANFCSIAVSSSRADTDKKNVFIKFRITSLRRYRLPNFWKLLIFKYSISQKRSRFQKRCIGAFFLSLRTATLSPSLEFIHWENLLRKRTLSILSRPFNTIKMIQNYIFCVFWFVLFEYAITRFFLYLRHCNA